MTAIKILGTALLLVASCVPTAYSQETSVEMHWIGLFGAYSRNPQPDDPLPDITLFPFGEIPRPLVRTNQVPAKLGSRFGFLFTLHGSTARSAEVRLVIHYPSPGFTRGIDQPKVEKTDDRVPCMADLPCYAGFSFKKVNDILPGEWRLELLIDGMKAEEATFVVAEDAGVTSNTQEETST